MSGYAEEENSNY